MQVTSVSEMAALFRQRAQQSFQDRRSEERAETRRVPDVSYGTKVFVTITGATGPATDPRNAAGRIQDDTPVHLLDMIL